MSDSLNAIYEIPDAESDQSSFLSSQLEKISTKKESENENHKND